MGDNSDPNQPDWELIKALYLQGLSYTDIIKRLPEQVRVTITALRKRASRHGWITLRQESASITSQEPTKDDKALANTSTIVRDRLARRLEQVSAVIERKPVPASVKSIKSESEALRPFVQNAKDVFGWSDGSASSVINILNLESAKVIEPPAIDVQATPVDPPQ